MANAIFAFLSNQYSVRGKRFREDILSTNLIVIFKDISISPLLETDYIT